MKILNLIKMILGADFFRELVDRLRTENPPFFKKLQVVIGVLIILIAGMHAATNAGYFPAVKQYLDILDSITLLLSGAFGVSFLAKKDAPKTMDGPGGPLPPPIKTPPPAK
ncbi:hypothetical protein ACTJJB_01515 [Chitinophaga sp. 22536]|uniref:hypothetical protein n=1 Tax=unclassified Chitinophaga TaxID=2619133 RepID=UPI003F8684E0